MKNAFSRSIARLIAIPLCLALLAGLFPARTFADSPATPLSIDALPLKTVQVDGASLGYRTLGQGEPLLCVMGYGGAMDVWDPAMIAKLAESFSVILFDNRGVGYSTASEAPFSIHLFAEDAAGLLDALDIESAHVLGWSMGAIIGLELAITRPDKVKKLVLYGAAPDNVLVMQAVESFAKLPKGGFKDRLFPKAWVEAHPDIFGILPSPAIPAAPECIARQRQAIENWPGVVDKLPDVAKETLLIYGDEDDVTPVSEGLRLVAGIKGSWLARFPGGGHWLMYQAPEQMAGLITLFLTSRENLLAP